MKKQKNSTVTMLAGTPVSDTIYYLAGTLDNLDKDIIFTRMFIYDDQATPSNQWFHHDLPGWAVISTCQIPKTSTTRPQICALSEQGDVEFYSSKGSKIEKIKGAGLDHTGHSQGYMNSIRYIGDTLYACGYNGQVYKRQQEKWEQFDLGIREKNPAQLTANDTPFDLISIQGLHESDIYITGNEGFIAHYNGAKWSILPPVTRACLYGIFIQSESEVWIAGSNGTIVQGNATDGFQATHRKSLDCDFYSITSFKGKIFIGASDGIYSLHDNKILKVNLPKQVIEVDSIETKNGVLWALSAKKIIKFDGDIWKIIDHIDNS
ncbi:MULTISPECIES: hypothetical protein [Pseudomonas]|uniref:Glycosyl hydrolase n=1 Tax=Pseudomonas capeferrum TaxID=1495066 RepID=A0ABY7REH9_9PSED|nr:MULTISPECIES: hypothetical protein [Pseudomonas]MUT53468.1 hypothetical protein [Pseudomonas sp. TDA1]WCI02193.1 hypothetical protein PMC74_10045 [Pseudomonas capeferrum]